MGGRGLPERMKARDGVPAKAGTGPEPGPELTGALRDVRDKTVTTAPRAGL